MAFNSFYLKLGEIENWAVIMELEKNYDKNNNSDFKIPVLVDYRGKSKFLFARKNSDNNFISYNLGDINLSEWQNEKIKRQ